MLENKRESGGRKIIMGMYREKSLKGEEIRNWMPEKRKQGKKSLVGDGEGQE